MISDFICATIPFFLLRHLTRSVVEKALIYVLMASSLIATAIGIPKLYHVLTYNYGGPDGLYELLPEFFWCRMEEAAIIMAACAPLLKCPVERVLKRMGLPTFKIPTRGLKSLRSLSGLGQGSDTASNSGPDSADSACWGGSTKTTPDVSSSTTDAKSTSQHH